ncbi:LysR family transcriptional regulator [Salmonella enterica]|nr:LysR family transcriptional regulator [Salmonella enterica]
MDLRRLHYFVTVAQLGSFSRAAEKLNISQPPLSQRIQELEEEVGVTLLDRKSRPLSLTYHGKILFEQAVEIIQRTEFMMDSMQRLLSEEKPVIKIGLVPANFHTNLATMIRMYLRAFPGVDIRITEMNSLEQIDALRTGKIDVGIGRVEIEADGITRVVLYEEPFIAVLPADHPLAIRDSPISLEEIKKEKIILYTNERRPSLADLISTELARFVSHPVDYFEVEQYDSALIMIAAGQGITFAPESAKTITMPGIVYRPLNELIKSPLVFSHQSSNSTENIRAFYSVILTFLRDRGYPVPKSILDNIAGKE